MKRFKKIMALALAGTMFLAGCGTNASETENTSTTDNTSTTENTDTADAEITETADASQGGKITFALQNEPDVIDPGITNNSFASPFITNIFEGLIAYDENSEIIPGSAESWEISEDGKIYTFKIRESLKWSDGSDLNANDFVYSYFRVLDPATGARYSNMLTDYILNANEYFEGTVEASEVGIKALDDNTLEITLIEPTPFFLGVLGIWVYCPVNQAVVEASPDRWTMDAATLVSNGPFKVSSIKLGEGIVLVKNENYWDAANVNLDEINFRYILDPSTALNAFEAGEIDGLKTIPAADMTRLKVESDAYYSVPSFGTTFYNINVEKEPFNDPKVREALSLALSRDDIINNVLQAPADPTISLVSPGYVTNGTDFADTHANYEFNSKGDIEKAKTLLAEAGYPNGEGFPTIELSYYTDENVKKVVEAMQAMWKENLNVETNIKVEDWAIYYERVQSGDYEIGAMGWGGDYLHPMTFLGLYESNSVNNDTNYSNAEYDDLIAQIKVETDIDKSVELMHQAEDIIIREIPSIFLYHRENTILVSNKVNGWSLDALSNLSFKYAGVTE